MIILAYVAYQLASGLDVNPMAETVAYACAHEMIVETVILYASIARNLYRLVRRAQ